MTLKCACGAEFVNSPQRTEMFRRSGLFMDYHETICHKCFYNRAEQKDDGIDFPSTPCSLVSRLKSYGSFGNNTGGGTRVTRSQTNTA